MCSGHVCETWTEVPHGVGPNLADTWSGILKTPRSPRCSGAVRVQSGGDGESPRVLQVSSFAPAAKQGGNFFLEWDFKLKFPKFRVVVLFCFIFCGPDPWTEGSACACASFASRCLLRVAPLLDTHNSVSCLFPLTYNFRDPSELRGSKTKEILFFVILLHLDSSCRQSVRTKPVLDEVTKPDLITKWE